MILGVEHGTIFGNLKCAWEEKWHPAISKIAETQKTTNKRVGNVSDVSDRSGIIWIYIPMLHYLPSYVCLIFIQYQVDCNSAAMKYSRVLSCNMLYSQYFPRKTPVNALQYLIEDYVVYIYILCDQIVLRAL